MFCKHPIALHDQTELISSQTLLCYFLKMLLRCWKYFRCHLKIIQELSFLMPDTELHLVPDTTCTKHKQTPHSNQTPNQNERCFWPVMDEVHSCYDRGKELNHRCFTERAALDGSRSGSITEHLSLCVWMHSQSANRKSHQAYICSKYGLIFLSKYIWPVCYLCSREPQTQSST